MTQNSGPRQLKVRIGSQDLSIRPDLTYTIGADQENDIRIVHGSISGRHAWLSWREGQVHVEDLGSLTGTWVDEERIQATSFTAGAAKLRFGDIQVHISPGEAAALLIPEFQSTHIGPGQHIGLGHHESFAENMAAVMRRTPWVLSSVAFHLIIYLFLLWWLVPPPPPNASVFATILATEDRSEVVGPHAEKDDPVEIERLSEEDQSLQDINLESEEVEVAESPNEKFNPFSNKFAEAFGDSDALFEKIKGRSNKDVLNLGGQNKLSGGFKRTVTNLRKTGLEIIFVFDSTGSMNPVLSATKDHIERMVGVLHFLIPETRIGIVTYRDRGPTEDYLTRSVPLGSDYYRSVNFMQSVDAGGGGDTPEAVFEALDEAITQQWQPGSKRVVVLIGDAPAQPKSRTKIKRLVRRFTRDGRSFVHSIMTTPHSGRGVQKATQDCFEDIAENGKGSCIFLEDEQQILKHVFSLAIGHEYQNSIDEVYRIADGRKKKVSTEALDLVRRMDLDRIERQLRKKTVPDDLVKALSKKRNRELAVYLVGVLRRKQFPAAGREAAAYALKRILELEVPPIDSETGGAINRRTEAWLRRRIDNQL
ncbi:MAG: FHA domain-containing protein [Planctomycetota bacterium]|jgi:hypothetical protein